MHAEYNYPSNDYIVKIMCLKDEKSVKCTKITCLFCAKEYYIKLAD